jgi:hypothetical protein
MELGVQGLTGATMPLFPHHHLEHDLCGQLNNPSSSISAMLRKTSFED